MHKMILGASVLSVLATAAAAPPSEVKRTVDAFVGNWTFNGKLTLPGGKAVDVKNEAFDCSKVAGGTVIACTGKADIPGVGASEDTALIAWDAEAKKLHLVGADSSGLFHDHVCAWKDDKTLTCDPLAVTVEGQPATVDFTAIWADAKNITMIETWTMKDGSKWGYEGKGRRR
ncbi:MAG TPA: hypothetical protein VKE22_06840 [Haliangiales bacterium]|nr:hypothetical protein [Haliangiales bacterium]